MHLELSANPKTSVGLLIGLCHCADRVGETRTLTERYYIKRHGRRMTIDDTRKNTASLFVRDSIAHRALPVQDTVAVLESAVHCLQNVCPNNFSSFYPLVIPGRPPRAAFSSPRSTVSSRCRFQDQITGLYRVFFYQVRPDRKEIS